MAEKGAHLTGTAFIKPSIFEIVAQESFAAALEPAFKKIFSLLLSRDLERYGHLVQWADECYALFNAILQRYYLRRHSASFSETFYGLKRVTMVESQVQHGLTKSRERLSLLLLVLCPYLKSKLRDLSKSYKIENLDGAGSTTMTWWMKLYRGCIVEGYRIVFIIYESLVLYNHLLYVSGKSIYPTPLLRLLSISVTYAEPRPVVGVVNILRKLRNNSFSVVSDGAELARRVITGSLEFGAFFLQFLAWWNQEEYRTTIVNLPVPAPPVVPQTANRYKGVCPICGGLRRTQTLLSVSGYVFCYQCILFAIQKMACCPITNYPAKEDDLIRLYIEE